MTKDTPSVISQEQLTKLMAGYQNSLPLQTVLQYVKSSHVDVYDKNTLYQCIIKNIKSKDSKEAALEILAFVEDIMNEKFSALSEKLISVSEGESPVKIKTSLPGSVTRKSPIFKRVE